jgi:hypothetical protein
LLLPTQRTGLGWSSLANSPRPRTSRNVCLIKHTVKQFRPERSRPFF